MPPASNPQSQRQPREPLELKLSLRFKFGDSVDETVTMLDEHPVKMVGTLLESRDRIASGFIRLLIAAVMDKPTLAKEVAPGLQLMAGWRSGKRRS